MTCYICSLRHRICRPVRWAKRQEVYGKTSSWGLLQEMEKQPLSEQAARLESAFDQWKDNFEQVDDVLVIGIRVS